jgi:DNA-binding HxlR family transcriptional regulator
MEMIRTNTECMLTDTSGSRIAQIRDRSTVDWPYLKRRLAAVRGRWDLAVIAHLARDVTRPSELIASINAQAAQDPELSWTVLTRTLRRLESEGYVGHEEISRLPRVTRYWLTSAGWRLARWLTRLDTVSQETEPADDLPCLHRGEGPPYRDDPAAVCAPGAAPVTARPRQGRMEECLNGEMCQGNPSYRQTGGISGSPGPPVI